MVGPSIQSRGISAQTPRIYQRLIKLSLINSLGFLLLVTVNVLGIHYGYGWFGQLHATISERYPNKLLSPGRWLYYLWGVIFLLQGLGVVSQFVMIKVRPNSGQLAIGLEYQQTIGYGWFLAWIFECGWYFAWVCQPPGFAWLQCDMMLCATLTSVTTMILMERIELTPGWVPYFGYRLPTVLQAIWLSLASQQAVLLAFSVQHHELQMVDQGWVLWALIHVAFFFFMGSCMCHQAEVFVEFYCGLWFLIFATIFSGVYDGRFIVLVGGFYFPTLLNFCKYLVLNYVLASLQWAGPTNRVLNSGRSNMSRTNTSDEVQGITQALLSPQENEVVSQAQGEENGEGQVVLMEEGEGSSAQVQS